MDLWTLLRTVARRWMVVIPTIAIVVAVGFSLANRADVKYKATGATLLLPPNSAVAPSNPYAESDPALLTTANALQRVIGQNFVRSLLTQRGSSHDYTVSVDDKAPILNISATAPTAALAMRSVDNVQAEVENQLIARESIAGADPTTRIVADRIVTPTKADKQLDDRNRIIGGMIVLGLAAVCAVALITDNAAKRRSQRRVERVFGPPMLGPSRANTGGVPVVVPVRHRPVIERPPSRVAFTDPVWPGDWPGASATDAAEDVAAVQSGTNGNGHAQPSADRAPDRAPDPAPASAQDEDSSFVATTPEEVLARTSKSPKPKAGGGRHLAADPASTTGKHAATSTANTAPQGAESAPPRAGTGRRRARQNGQPEADESGGRSNGQS